MKSWETMMQKLRQHPRAVCTSLLITLKSYRPLSANDEERVIRSIESTGISVDDVLAHLSRNVLEKAISNM